MTTIFSTTCRAAGFVTVVAAGFALAGCAGPAPGGPARYAANSSARVMSDALPVRHAALGLGAHACVPDTQTFAADCGGFVRYDGP